MSKFLRILSIATALALVACGGAQPPVEGPAAALDQPSTGASAEGARPPAPPAPLNLWRVRSPSGAVSTMLGTYHMGVSLEEAVPGARLALLDGARVVVLELDTTGLDPAAALQAGMLPEGEDLRAMLPQELWIKLLRRLPQLPEPFLRRLAPWMVMSLVMASEVSSDRSSASSGEGGQASAQAELPPMLDEQVRHRATERQIPIHALETFEEQVAVIRRIPLEAVVEYLRVALMTPEASRAATQARTDAYAGGDVEPIEAELRREIASAPGVWEALLFVRNERWMEPLVRELEQGGAFVAVGLGHMLFERGLIAQLRARGYTVERITRGVRE